MNKLQFLDMSKNIDYFKMELPDDLKDLANKLFVKSKETITNELVKLVEMVQKEYINNPEQYEDEKWVRKVVTKEIKVPKSKYFGLFTDGYTIEKVKETKFESVKTVYQVQDMDCTVLMTDLCEQIVSGKFTLDTLYENS